MISVIFNIKWTIVCKSIPALITVFLINSLVNFTEAQIAETGRPRVGVVLSGGGAKGLAHIGVLKVLEEAGIHPDYITGTSMGGIVGGLYSIGYTAEQLEKIAKSTKWNYYLSDDIPRRTITFEEKEDFDRFVVSIPIAEKGIKIPGGVINGQNIENLLNQLCAPVYNIRDFSKFPTPFKCIATDIETGKEVVFSDGYLPDALRATMSIPSIFNPIEINGKLLVDGGLINNFPVNHVKDMGADIIIGVDVGFQSYSKDQLNSMFRIIEQSLFFYGEGNNIKNRQLCNIIISPPLSKYNAGSFNAADTIISLGETAARQFLPRLKALSDSLNALYPDHPIRNKGISDDSIFISEIKVEGLEKVSAELLRGKLQLTVMQKYSSEDIGRAVDRLYSSLYFEKVSYELVDIGEGVRLVIRTRENADGHLRLGLHYDSNYKSAILLNTTFRNLVFNGSKLSVSTGLGENPFFKAEVFKNNGWKPGLGLNFQSSRSEAFLYNNSRKISSLNFFETKMQIYTMGIFRNSHAIGAGIEYENSLIRPVIDPGETITESRYKLINYYAFLQMDSYDNLFYPTRGIKVNSSIKLITSDDFKPTAFLQARISKADKIGEKATLISHLYAGTVDGDSIPSQYLFFSGGTSETNRNGVMPFAGLDFMEISSRNVLSMKFDFQYRVYNDIYLTALINAGNFKSNLLDLFTVDHVLAGYGAALGYNSLIGPMEVTVSRSFNHSGFQGYLRIGYWF